MKRCAHCNGRFGLVRYRRGMQQFCKRKCREDYAREQFLEVRRRQSWYEYLMHRPSTT